MLLLLPSHYSPQNLSCILYDGADRSAGCWHLPRLFTCSPGATIVDNAA